MGVLWGRFLGDDGKAELGRTSRTPASHGRISPAVSPRVGNAPDPKSKFSVAVFGVCSIPSHQKGNLAAGSSEERAGMEHLELLGAGHKWKSASCASLTVLL